LSLRAFYPQTSGTKKQKPYDTGCRVVGQKTQQRRETYSSARIETPDPGKMIEFISALRMFSSLNFCRVVGQKTQQQREDVKMK